MSDVPERSSDELFERIAAIVEAARGHVARSVNTAMVHAYWHIGREIMVGVRRARAARPPSGSAGTLVGRSGQNRDR